MKKLDHLIPTIKNNLKAFDKPEVLYVRPGYRLQDGWPTQQEVIVVVSRAPRKLDLPSTVEGVPVEVRQPTEIEQFGHDNLAAYSKIAEHRSEFQDSFFPEFVPATADLKPTISPAVSAERQTKPEIAYSPASVPLTPVRGKIPLICHVSPDAGWSVLKGFISGTKSHLKVSMYDFTSAHILNHFNEALKDKNVQITLDAPPRNPTADQSDVQTVQSLKDTLGANLASAWALVRSSPQADTWIYPTAYHIKVMVRDSDTVWISSGNLNNSNQPEIDPIAHPDPNDQATAKKSDRDWHVVVESVELAALFEAYLDHDFQVASQHSASQAFQGLTAGGAPMPALLTEATSASGDFTFVAPQAIAEDLVITPLLTPDPGIYQEKILSLIHSVQSSLSIQLQYIHPSNNTASSRFTDLIDAVASKIDAGLDVKIILSEFQKLRGGLEALQAAGINLDHVKIQNHVHNKGFVFDHKTVVVSSMNWSAEGVLNNRDAGVVIENPTVATYYENVFLDDWAHHSSQG